MYYRGDVQPHRTQDEKLTELQHLTKQHEYITDLFVSAKLNARALLDQVFPAYEQVFYNVFSATSLTVLARCLEGDAENMLDMIQEHAGKSHSKCGPRKKQRSFKRFTQAGWNSPRARHKFAI